MDIERTTRTFLRIGVTWMTDKASVTQYPEDTLIGGPNLTMTTNRVALTASHVRRKDQKQWQLADLYP